MLLYCFECVKPFATLSGYAWTQSKWTEADEVFRRAVDVGEKSLGGNHPSIAAWLSHHARVLKYQVQSAEGGKHRYIFLGFAHVRRPSRTKNARALRSTLNQSSRFFVFARAP